MLLVAALAAALSGCALPGQRTEVDDETARDRLTQAIGLAVAGNLEGLCRLSPADASTCGDSVADFGDLVPSEAPTIRCSLPAPSFGPLRGGHLLVLEGRDADGEEYLTDFVVYDDGQAIGVLDAVWWSGLTVVDYDAETVTWRFDSTTTACDTGGLPTN